MRAAPIRPERAPDAGFTLVELLVAVVVGGLALAVIGAFLISSLQADRQLRGLNDATAQGELALDAMRTTLQSVTPPIAVAAGAGAGDLVLRATVASQGAGPVRWQCIAYYYDAARRELRTQRHAGGDTTPPSRIATPDAAALAGWPILAAGVLPPSDGAIFAPRDRDPGPGVEADPGAIDVAFRIDAGELGTPEFRTAIVARSQQPGGVACAP